MHVFIVTARGNTVSLKYDFIERKAMEFNAETVIYFKHPGFNRY